MHVVYPARPHALVIEAAFGTLSKIITHREAEGAATNMSVIDEAAALEATGENRLEGIRQLIMRGKKLASFERSCAIRLRRLTVSHARVEEYVLIFAPVQQ